MRQNNSPDSTQTNQEEKETALLRHFNNSLKLENEQLQKEIALLRQLNEGLCWVIFEMKQKYSQGAAPLSHLQLPSFLSQKGGQPIEQKRS